MKDKVRELTSRSNGWSYEYRKQRLTWYIRGWSNYFSLAGYKRSLEYCEAMSDERLKKVGYPTFTEYYVGFNKANYRIRYESLKELNYRSLVHEFYERSTSSASET